jgi:CRP-like cAMP-binding protein
MASTISTFSMPFSERDLATMQKRILTHGWLREAAPDHVSHLLALAQWRRISGGSTIYRSESQAGDLYAVADGQIAVSHHNQSNMDVENIHLYRVGDWFGYAPILCHEPRRFQTTARTDCVVAVIPEGQLRALLVDKPHYWHLMALIADAQGRVNALAALDLTRRSHLGRLCATLLRLAGCRLADGPDGPPFDIAISQTELAEASNLSRNGVSRRLQGLERDGHIALHYRHISVLRPDTLRKLLDAS